MKSKTPVVGPSTDAQMQQDLEDMRAELLREIQDGDEMEDEWIEVVSLEIARIRQRPDRSARGRETTPGAHG